MAVDNTHNKYLKGSDKKAWERYKKELEAQAKTQAFLDNFKLDDSGSCLVASHRPQGNVKKQN